MSISSEDLAQAFESIFSELNALRDVKSVASKILTQWEKQEARATKWMQLAAKARAAKTQEERELIKLEKETLNRVSDFGDLRHELGEALNKLNEICKSF